MTTRQHIILTPAMCPNCAAPHHRGTPVYDGNCQVCDHGLSVCGVCGMAESELAGPCPGLPRQLALWFDGLCEPNPGGWSTYGWCIRDANADWPSAVLAEGRGIAHSYGHKNSTNNVAEYIGLGKALRELMERQWRGKLTIRGDSQLVINQLTHRFACNSEKLKPLMARCRELLVAIGNDYQIMWIPRDENKYCDQLSNLAYDEIIARIAGNQQ